MPLVVITGHGYHKVLQFVMNKSLSVNDENAMELAYRVKTLTGDWVSEIKCEDIRAEDRGN